MDDAERLVRACTEEATEHSRAGNVGERDDWREHESIARQMRETLLDFAAWRPEEGVSIEDLGAWVRERAEDALNLGPGA